ncbi:hypothetical protein YC2023_117398 [Brassica napus]
MDIKLNWNSSLLLGRAFLATVGAVCDMNTNRLCLTLIDPDVHYYQVQVVRQQFNLVELGNDLGYIAACHCGAEYETEYSESIDTHTVSSIDFNESPTTDESNPMSLDGKQPVDHFILPDQCYPDFAFQQPNNRGRDDYSIGSWPDSGFHESFAVDTIIPSSNEDPTEEYDEDYWRERGIEIAMQDDNIQAIPSTTRLHHRSAKFTQHRSIPTLTQQNVLMHRSIPYLVHRSILKPPPLKRKKGTFQFQVGFPIPI